MEKSLHKNGFTIVEILVALAILIVIGSIGTYVFVNAKNAKTLDVATQAVVFTLNEARTNAIAGKGGSNFGVKFDTNSFIHFSGLAYDPSDPDNIVYEHPKGIVSTTTYSGSNDTIIFGRMTGKPQGSGQVTISKEANPGLNQYIEIGAMGEFNVIK